MKILKSLYLKNVGPFKLAELPLDVQGITQIRGINKDSKEVSSQKDVNAVGKSLLLRPISEIIFSSSPTTQNIKSRTKKDMFSDSNTEFGLSVKTDKLFTFSKHSDKKSYDYKVLENGKDSKVRTKGYAQEKIKKIFDYTEDEFYSIYFIDSRRISNLVMGTATQRIEFFTNLFRLHDYDNVRKIFNSKLNEAKKSVAVLKEINSQITELEKDIEGFDSKDLLEKKNSLRKTNKELVASYEKINAKNVKLLNAFSHKEAYLSYVDLSKQLNLKGSVKEQKNKLKTIIDELESNLKLAKQWEYFNTANKNYIKKKEKLEGKIDPIYLDKGLKFVKNTLSTLQDNEKDLKKELSSLVTDKPEFDLTEYKKLKSKNLDSIDYYKEKISKLESKCEIYENSIESLKKLHGDNCPTCQGKIDHKIINRLKSEYKKKIGSMSSEISALRKSLVSAKQFEKLKDEYETYQKESLAYKKSLTKKDKLEKALGKVSPKISKLSKTKSLLESLTSLDKPKKPKKDLVNKPDSKHYKKCLNCYTTLKTLESIFDELQKVNYKTLEKDLKKYQTKVKKLSKEIENNSVALSKVVSKLDLFESNSNRLQSLKTKSDSLKQVTEDIPIIESIIEAYSNKGIKLLVIKHIAQMLETNINKYVNLLYAEPTKFKFEVKDERNFNIYIHRKVRGVFKDEDIRTLSGAESRAFSFLLPLGILPLIPNERRLNLMVLDEPMANMGEARKNLFIESFIPKLNSVVPHLIITTTDNENYPNANVYTVVKENGVSKLAKN